MNMLKGDLKRAGMTFVPVVNNRNAIVVSHITETNVANFAQNKKMTTFNVANVPVKPPKVPEPTVPNMPEVPGVPSSIGRKSYTIPGLPDLGGITAIIGSN